MEKMYEEMERQYTEETASCRKTEIFRKIFQALKEKKKRLIIGLSGLHLIIKSSHCLRLKYGFKNFKC